LPGGTTHHRRDALCLGKRKEAVTHLQEVLRNDKLGFDVKSEARDILQKWGESS
jgi:hypothetical protein